MKYFIDLRIQSKEFLDNLSNESIHTVIDYLLEYKKDFLIKKLMTLVEGKYADILEICLKEEDEEE